MATFTGEHGVGAFVATALASGLRLYAKTGMRPNRAWTPTAMLRKAESLTGQKFKRGEYIKAADALKVWADAEAAKARDKGQIKP